MCDGYRVQAEGIQELARKVSEYAADLAATDFLLRSRGGGSADELGEQASGAFAVFFQAWSAETKVIGDALSTRLVESAAEYASAETAAADSFGQVIAGSGQVD